MSTAGRLNDLLSRVIRTALLPATAGTTAAVAISGAADNSGFVAPINAISHIVWGETAAKQQDASLQYTATGIALNAVAVTAWSMVYELLFGGVARKGNAAAAVLGGVAVAGLAYVTDYYVVPRRLTPGFEKRLSPISMFVVYSTLAASLSFVSLLERQMTRNGRSFAGQKALS